MNDPQSFYKAALETHEADLARLLKIRNALGWIRFIVFVITVYVAYCVFDVYGLWGIIPLLSGIGLLLYLVSRDVNNNQKISNKKMLISINEEEMLSLRHQFLHRYDGHHLMPEQHPYAGDLDLFGKSSLFQWMNRCYSDGGKELLAKNLLSPLSTNAIIERQEAVRELAGMIAWRQQLQSFSAQAPITKITEERTVMWLEDEDSHFTGAHWKIITGFYPFITIGSAMAAAFGYIPGGIFSFLYGIFLTTSIILSRNTIKPYLHLSGIVKEITTLQQLMAWIESVKFSSLLLQKKELAAQIEGETAALQIRKLKNILDRFDLRLNIAGLLFFNAFLLWDVRQMIALNKWRKKNRTRVPHWFELIAEIEVIHSLATIHFNHPQWCFPEFNQNHFTFRSRNIGHPLIPENVRVNSDFDLERMGKIGLITGSNMAGKSTFLRTLGVNVVLAQAGSPVSASQMEISPVQLMSSMRIADNLAENTSTFYAELKKLKTIIEAVNRKENLFILLDEILRGTNSLDRHTGSAALIKQLINQQAVAVIATHDIELATLEKEYPDAIENYHFDVQVEGEELYFDYRLKHGVCTSLNASILMKKIGIELES